MAYIGLDIGSSGCKASIITKDAVVLAKAYAEYDLKFPYKGFVELDSLEIYQKVKEVLKEIAPMARDVTALSLSSFGEAFVLLDKGDKALCNFITYADNRCSGIDKELIERISSEKFFKITGVVPNQSFSLCKLLWLRKHNPEILSHAEGIYLANDYYNYMLSGNRGVDYGTASKTLLFDIHKKDWSDELLHEFGFPKKWFSPIKKVGTSLGKIKMEVAEEIGFPLDIEIYLGCHDQCSATLGGGAYFPESAVIGEGSTESFNVIVDNSIFKHSDEIIKRKLCIEPFLTDNFYIFPASILTYGNSIKWYISIMEVEAQKNLAENETIFEYLEKNSEEETNLIFLPNLTQVNIMNPDSKVPGSFIGITLETKKWEFYRAVLQGLNFETKENFDVLKSIGVPIHYISATGGITHSSKFMQLKADILQMDMNILENAEAGITGLAMICAVAEGDYKDYKEAIEKFVLIKKVFYPTKDYSVLFQQYSEIRKKLK